MESSLVVILAFAAIVWAFWLCSPMILLAAVLAVFFQSDADLPIVFLPYKEEGAFAGKIIWITGASSGIGAGLAEDMVRAGAKVVISARRVSQLEAVADKCALVGDRPYVLPLDVTDFAAQAEAVKVVLEVFGRVDSLVLNAGMSQCIPAEKTDLSVTQELMHLNFMSIVSLSKLLLPSMLARGAGQLVIMSSVGGIIGTPLSSSYSASKFALHGYFNALRGEVDSRGVGVTIVCPGPVISEIVGKAHRNADMPVCADSVAKMPTARCTHLISKAMHYGFYEVWVSQQPILFFTYFYKYAPFLGNLLTVKIEGPGRMLAMETGGDVYDTQNELKKSRKAAVAKRAAEERGRG